MRIRYYFILFPVLLSAIISATLRADEPAPDKKIGGTSFLPRTTRIVADAVTIEIPLSCSRTDTEHAKEKYPITFFTAGCGGASPCLTLSIMVMILPESVRGYDDVVKRSLKEDFGVGEVRRINEKLILSSGSGADRVSLYYGPSFLAGKHIIGYYHSRKMKKTAKAVVGLNFIDVFPEEEWQGVLVNSVDILKSLKFVK